VFTITLYTRHEFDSREKAADLFRFFNEAGGSFKPARFDLREPVRKIYDPAELSAPADLLSGAPNFKNGGVMLKGAKHRFLAWIRWRSGGVSPWYMWLSEKFFERAERVEEFMGFIAGFCERFPVLFGSACPGEDWDAKHYYISKSSGRRNFTLKVGDELDSCLPGVYWLTIFGQPLVEHFGRERIESLPVQRVMDFGAGGLGIVLRASPYGIEKSERLSHDAEIMKLLGGEYFFDVSQPKRPCQPISSVTQGGSQTIGVLEALESASEPEPEFGLKDLKNVTVLDAVGEPITDLSSLAEMLVVFLQGEVNEAFEYSRAALEAIDRHFAEHPQRVEYKPEHLNKEFIPTLGAYLGEVMVRNLKAEWVAREPLPKSTIRLGDTEISPFESAYRSVYEGARLSDVYDSLARLPSS
jgi:hypothetical protein